MAQRSRRILVIIEAFVLAPVLVAVTLGALLLFGVPPQLVFLPGRAVMALLITLGLPASNRVGVVATGMTWWALIVAARVAVERLTRLSNRGHS